MSGPIREFVGEDCPVCGQRGWCGRRDDGLILCKRPPIPREMPGLAFVRMAKDEVTGMYVESGRERGRRFVGSSVRTSVPSTSQTAHDKTSARSLSEDGARFVKDLTTASRDELSGILGLPVSALAALEIGWWPERQWWNPETRQREGDPGCWTIPECDAHGKIIGFSLRWRDGRKGHLAGGRRGLVLPSGWREFGDPLIVVEGASDVLAGRTIGLSVVGRPNNSGGAEFLAQSCRHRRMIILGENDRKIDGRWPGREGPEAVARKLSLAWERPIPVALPPDGAKDLRAWLVARIATLGREPSDDDLDIIRTQFLDAIQPPQVLLFICPVRNKRGQRVTVKAFRWADAPAAGPVHVDKLNIDDERDRARFAAAVAARVAGVSADELAARLMQMEIPEVPKPSRSTIAIRPEDQESDEPDGTETPTSSASARPAALPEVELPGDDVSISESAAALGKLLAPTQTIFVRGRAVVEVVSDKTGRPILEPVKPAALASSFEKVAKLVRLTVGRGGVAEKVATICSESTAKLIMSSHAFLDTLPVLLLISPTPVLIERDGRLITVAGYDCQSGILAHGSAPPAIALNDAVKLLHDVICDFEFATQSDRSRALAALITPALVFAGILGGRAPVDLSEADESQAGKGYRNKLTAAIYGCNVTVVSQRKGGVGGMEESFDSALIAGALFVSLDNVRGKLDSPRIESFLTEDSYLARVPYSSNVEIDTHRVITMFTSNKAEITPDLANRSSVVRIRKRPAHHRFRRYPKGDILEHVKANQSLYLAAVFAVVRAWYAAGRPASEFVSHDFRGWGRRLDFIVQKLLGAAPLLDGHRDIQTRVATPVLNWLRDVALAVDRAGRLGEPLRAHEILEIVDSDNIEVPGIDPVEDLRNDANRQKALLRIGRQLGKCFRKAEKATIDQYEILRAEDCDQQGRIQRSYTFCAVNPVTPNRPTAAPNEIRDSPHFPAFPEGVQTFSADAFDEGLGVDALPFRDSLEEYETHSGNEGKLRKTGLACGDATEESKVQVTVPSLTPDLQDQLSQQKFEALPVLGGGCDGTARHPTASLPSPMSGQSSHPVARLQSVGDIIKFGDICDGWSPKSWAAELRRKATRCDEYRPDIAKYYREWAADIERRLGTGDLI